MSVEQSRMPKKESEEHQLTRWIREIERHYPQAEIDLGKRLKNLLEGLISQSAEQALHFLRKHKGNGIQSLPGLKCLMDLLAHRLLSNKKVHQVEELCQLGAEWNIPVDGAILRQLAKVYAQEGSHAKAYEILQPALKKDCQTTEVLHSLYDLASALGRTTEAHALLNRLIQADLSLATITFAYKERKKLPPDTGQPVRIALLSSYVLDQLIPYLDFECRRASLTPEFYLAPFNQYTQETLNTSSSLYQFKAEIIFIALALEDLFPEVTGYPSGDDLDKASKEIRKWVLRLIGELHERCHALIVLHEFALMHRTPHGILDNRSSNGLARWIEDLNHILADDLRSQERAYLLPLNQVLSWVGKDQSNNPKMRYMASMRVGEAALPELARYSMRYVKPLKGLTRKCIVLDLDGTLWGGIVGELGVEGIHLGPTAPGVEYMDFQKALLNLTRRGILLAVCSKNNPEDAMPVIRDHKYMLLREEHFSAMRINWRNKAANLREIAQELNIGFDSIVFIDDSPTERELVRQLLPEVLTVELPTDPSRYRMTLEDMSDFELLAITREDEKRGAQYQTMRKRAAVRNTTASLEEYLHSLDMKAEITLASSEALNRLVQMFNKTNQFNLTTRRYQMADMDSFLNSDKDLVYALQVSDRFGDHGLVGAAIIHEEGQRWRIDSLVMSCRVMGLSVERAFLHRIYDDARQAGITTLIGEFIPTKKNQPVKDFYHTHGFRLINETDGHQIWDFSVKVGRIDKPSWITTTGVSARYDSRADHRQSF